MVVVAAKGEGKTVFSDVDTSSYPIHRGSLGYTQWDIKQNKIERDDSGMKTCYKEWSIDRDGGSVKGWGCECDQGVLLNAQNCQ